MPQARVFPGCLGLDKQVTVPDKQRFLACCGCLPLWWWCTSKYFGNLGSLTAALGNVGLNSSSDTSTTPRLLLFLYCYFCVFSRTTTPPPVLCIKTHLCYFQLNSNFKPYATILRHFCSLLWLRWWFSRTVCCWLESKFSRSPTQPSTSRQQGAKGG